MSIDRIVRPCELRKLFGDISETTLHRWIKDGKVPRPQKLVEGGRAVGWSESVVRDLLPKQKPAAVDQ